MMAELLSRREARNYGVGCNVVDLIALIGVDAPTDWRTPESVHDVSVAQTAYVAAMGRMRRGVIVKVTKTKVYVAFTTQGAVDDAVRYNQPDRIRVQITATTPDRVRVAPLPTLEQDIERITAGQARLATEMGQVATEVEALEQELAQAGQLEAATDAVCGCLLNPLGHTQSEHWAITHPDAAIEHTERKTSSSPEAGWSSQCRAQGCPGHWRTGYATQDEARAAYELHEMTGHAPEQNDAPPATGSTVVKMLEDVWTAIQANHPDLPDVVIVTGAGLSELKSARWGHHRPNGWSHTDHQLQAEGVTTNVTTGEMFIAGETLAKGAAFTVEVMLHEAAHALARVRDIKDTSRQGRWHNANFLRLAEELGLEHPKDKAHPQHGYSFVTWTPGTREEYDNLIQELDKMIRLTVPVPVFARTGNEQGEQAGGEHVHGGRRPRGQADGPSSNNLKLTCLCEEPNIIRASRKVADKMVVRCDDCGSRFEARD